MNNVTMNPAIMYNYNTLIKTKKLGSVKHRLCMELPGPIPIPTPLPSTVSGRIVSGM